MKGFKLTENGDISITNGQIEMVDGIDLETQTIRTVLGTNKRESPFNANEGVDFYQIIGKDITDDMTRTQIQNGIWQVNPDIVIEDYERKVTDRQSEIIFTARSSDGSVITGGNTYS